LGFGEVPLCQASQGESIIITNGDETLTVSQVEITGPDKDQFRGANSGFTLAPHGKRLLASVQFVPTTAGPHSADLLVYSNADGSPHFIHLTGTGVASTLGLSDTQFDFGSVRVLTNSNPKSLTLTAGSGCVTISSITITGDNPGDFVVDQSPLKLNPGAKHLIGLYFSPTGRGPRRATLTFYSDAQDSPQTIPLTGIGIGPDVSIDPTHVDFGEQPLSIQSLPQIVTVTNTGDDKLTIYEIGIRGSDPVDFERLPLVHNMVLSPGASVQINVTFRPRVLGPRAAELYVSTDVSITLYTVPLSGVGVTPATPGISVTPLALTFASQKVGTSSTSQTVTVKSTGTAPLLLGQVRLDGPNAGDFSFSPDLSNTSIPAITEQQVSVTFTPTAAGSKSATLHFPSNAPGGERTVTLSGQGVDGNCLVANPTSLNFGNQQVGSCSAALSITLTNKGACPPSSAASVPPRAPLWLTPVARASPSRRVAVTRSAVFASALLAWVHSVGP
jgi:hypothetical protein